MSGEDLSTLHLADLHARAGELGIERFRMLSREQLIEAIEAADSGDPEAGEGDGRPRRRRRGGRGRGRGRGRGDEAVDDRVDLDIEPDLPDDAVVIEADEADDEAEDIEIDGDDGLDDDEAETDEEVETEPVTGILDRLPQGHGFLRLSGYSSADGDVYVSASQIRRCELRSGDQVAGPARAPRRGERHPALVQVESVNGEQPESERHDLDRLDPAGTERPIFSDPSSAGPLSQEVGIADRLAFGQRVLVVADPGADLTALLREIAIAVAERGAQLMIVLSGESEDGAEAWRKLAPKADLHVPSPDQQPRDQVHLAELIVARAKRLAEAGEDVVVLLDSLSLIASGYRDPTRARRILGAGLDGDAEGVGSVTVIGTLLRTDESYERVADALDSAADVVATLESETSDPL